MPDTLATGSPAPIQSRSPLLGPQDGVTLNLNGLPLRFLWAAGQTRHRVEIHEHLLSPGALVPAHCHDGEDQWNYVLEGTVHFLVGKQVYEAPAGCSITRRARVPHALWNSGSVPARFLEASTPADNISTFFHELDAMTRRGEVTPGTLAALGARYGITYDFRLTAELAEQLRVGAGSTWRPS